MFIALALFCALLTFFIVFVVYFLFKRAQSTDIIYRLRRHNLKTADNKTEKKEPLARRIFLLVKRMARPISSWKFARNLDFKLRQAGVPLYGAEFIILAIVGALIVAALSYVITMNVLSAPILGLLFPLLLWSWISILIKRRRDAFTEQLGDCLTTVANALRAGYSFQQAMDVVSREMEPPISTEFRRVMTDITMGVALETALEQMNKRVGSADFDLVVTAVLIQREVGGNLAQILDIISDTINERIRMKREINALTAQGRLSAWVLIALPIFMAIFCWTFNKDQMMVFVTEEVGRYAIIFAILMEIFGYIVIQKIVDIEV